MQILDKLLASLISKQNEIAHSAMEHLLPMEKYSNLVGQYQGMRQAQTLLTDLLDEERKREEGE